MLRSLVDSVFRKGGVLEQIDPVRYQFRPAQYDFAIAYAEFLEGAQSKDNRVPIRLAEVGTGVGKTIPSVIVLAIATRLSETTDFPAYGRRGMIATYTKSLRDEIVELETLANQVLAGLSLASVSIANMRSISSIASLRMANDIVRQYNRASVSYYKDAVAYRDAIEAAEAAGKIYQMTDWLDAGNDFEFHTVGRGGSSADKMMSALAIDITEFNQKVKAVAGEFAQFKDDNANAKLNADLVIVTHTMFVLNGMMLGGILKTNKRKVTIETVKKVTDDKEPFRRAIAPTADVFNVIVDEADQFVHQSSTTFNTSFSLDSVRSLYRMQGRKVPPAIGRLQKALDQHPLGFSGSRVSKNISYESERELIIRPLRDVFNCVRDILDDPVHSGLLYRDHAATVAQSLYRITEWFDLIGSTNFKAAFYDKARLEFSVRWRGKGDYNATNYEFTLAATSGSHLVSRPWRNYNVHAFSSLMLMSGTIFDHQGKDASFRRMVGVGDYDNVVGSPIHIPSTGRAEEIVFCKGPSDIWSNNLVSLQSENNQGTREMSEEFEQHVCDMIAAATKDQPALILVTSYLRLAVLEKQLKGNFIYQKRGERSADFVKRIIVEFQKGNRVSAVCLFWSGVNFVMPNGAGTIYSRVVIPLLPFSPITSPHAGYVSIRNNHTEAYWKTKQGIGRIFRHPVRDTVGEIWIGDPRLKLNPAYAHVLQYEGGNKHFDLLFADVERRKPNPTIISLWESGKIIKRGKLL